MFEKEMSRSQRMIESELERSLIHLKTEQVYVEDYKKTLSVVERLHGLLDKEKPETVSKNTALIVAANLLGILLIINHEYANPITSKALNFVTRLR